MSRTGKSIADRDLPTRIAMSARTAVSALSALSAQTAKTALSASFFTILLLARSADAQQLRGTVREKDSGAKLQGVFVTLLDSLKQVRYSTLTDENGGFALRIPFAGSFVIQAELIGHTTVNLAKLLYPTVSPVAEIQLPVAPIELSAIEAEGGKRCVARPESARQTQRLWEEMRKALRVASWTEKQNAVVLDVRNYTRVLDPYTLRVKSEQLRPGRNRDRAWEAIAPDTLARYGFARSFGRDSVLYFGPDADVLLSEAFLDTHCFDVRIGSDDNRGLVGLTFRPIPKRKQPEIAGTLWLNPRTSELHYIEYRFTPLPNGIKSDNIGGRTYFTRLQNGAWIVNKWYLRLPVAARSGRGDLSLIGISEQGGEIVSSHPLYHPAQQPKM